MNWLVFAGLNILALSFYSFFSKFLSGKISTSLRVFIMGIGVFFAATIWFLYTLKTGSKLTYDKTSLILSALAGLLAGLAIIFFQLIFTSGASLAIGNLVARVGVIILGAILGIVILKEPLTLKILAGFLLAILGIYLLIVK